MRLLMLVAVAAVGVAGLLAPWGAERARACSIGAPTLGQLMQEADVIVVGTLSETGGLIATVTVERHYKHHPGLDELRVDNREINTTPWCAKMYMDTPRFSVEGPVVAFLERTDPGAPADYEFAWFGLGLFYISDGELGYWEEVGDGEERVLQRTVGTLEEVEEVLQRTVGFAPPPFPVVTSGPAPTATETPPVAPTATSELDTPAPPVSGDAGSGGSGGMGRAVVWLGIGAAVGAAGVGGVWWAKARGGGA